MRHFGEWMWDLIIKIHIAYKVGNYFITESEQHAIITNNFHGTYKKYETYDHVRPIKRQNLCIQITDFLTSNAYLKSRYYLFPTFQETFTCLIIAQVPILGKTIRGKSDFHRPKFFAPNAQQQGSDN